MREIVIFAVGSPIVVDYEASLHRAQIPLAAAIKNRPGQAYLLDLTKLVNLETANIPELKNCPYMVPLFTPAHRQMATREATAVGFLTPFSLVDPTVPALYQVAIGPGAYINAGCVLGAACKLGEFVLINRAATVGHHSQLGRFVSIGPGAVLAGDVAIGDGAVIGAGAIVLPNLSIGTNAVVAAGSVVTKSVPAHTMVAGNPAQAKKSGIAGYGNLAVD